MSQESHYWNAFFDQNPFSTSSKIWQLWVILYTVGKVWMRRLQRRWNRRKRFSIGGEIPWTSLTIWILGGELILEVCLGLLVVWIAAYGYLRCCHRLCQKGDGLFIQESMQRIQENRVNMGSLSFPSYLFFHTSDSGQIWYPLKAVIKDYPTLLRARRMKTNSWRTLEVIGTNLLA